MKDVWQEEHLVRVGDVDRSDRLTLAKTFDLFQEAAISHAEDLGVGREALAKTGQAWILSRMSVFARRRPRFGERVVVRSWPRSWEKLFTLRDYAILDETGAAVVRGRSGWLILDRETRRPLRVREVVEPLPANEGNNAFVALSPGLEGREGLVLAGMRVPAYSDIDFNGHVNNTRYIQWIQDITAFETLETAAQTRLDINYLSEVRPGEAVELWSGAFGDSGESPAGDYPERPEVRAAYEGRRAGAGKPVFRAELRTGE
ncbi:MAG: acyl-ACP thioesterase [Treponematales bacterium]